MCTFFWVGGGREGGRAAICSGVIRGLVLYAGSFERVDCP